MKYSKLPLLIIASGFLCANSSKSRSRNDPRESSIPHSKTAEIQRAAPHAAPSMINPPRVEQANPTRSSSPFPPNMTRTPSMSRIKFRSLPGQPLTGPRSQTESTRPISPITAGQIPHARNLRNMQASVNQRRQQYRKAAILVKDQMRRDHPEHRHWFNRDFFDRHHFHAGYFNDTDNWWQAPTWGSVTYWLGTSWSSPYDYSEEENPVEVMPVADTINPISPSISGDWLPLGVFAVGKTADQASFSDMFVQLVVNKEGDIAGTYYNATTDQTHPIAGMINTDTQQALWKVSDNPDSPLMSTGVYNLTQDATSVQLAFPSGAEQTWYLVRVN